MALWLAQAGEGALAQRPSDADAFARILHDYRTRRADAAIDELAAWPADRVAAAAHASSATLSSSDRMAAAIVEAEVIPALLVAHRSKDVHTIVESAIKLLHDAGRAPFGDRLGEEPRRSWFYATTSALVGYNAATEAFPLIEIGLKSFHDDPLLLTARGTISERRLDVIGYGHDQSIGRARTLMTFQGKAIADYKLALKLRPGLTVARLRLGHLYIESGHESAAAPWLQSIAIGEATVNEQFLLHLLLGRIAVKERRLDAADAEYHQAYSIGRYQSACFAVRQVDDALERDPHAGETVEDCLQESGRDDPWVYWRIKADPDALPHLRAEARGE